jgi:transcriptional regulator with PAS, ATPase and Fis domain
LAELENAKKWLIENALKKFNNNKTLAAKQLGISYQGLAYLLKNKKENISLSSEN